MAKTSFSASPSDPTPTPNATFLNTIYGSSASGGHRHDAGTNDGSADKIDFPNEIKNMPWLDVRAYASFSAAISAIGSVNPTALLIPNSHTVSSDLTVTSNIHVIVTSSGSITTSTSGTDLIFNGALSVYPGGTFSVGSSTTIAINGHFDAGDFTVFSGSGTISGLQVVNPMWYGATDDGTTDNTSTILTAASGGNNVLIIPRGMKFNRKTLLASLPTSVVCLDFSVINDFASGGETTKKVGILSKDADINDTHWSVDSDHHAVIALNNHGGADSTSASERKGSLVWNVGQFELGSTDKRGYRGAALFQFTKETGGSYWKLGLRSLAPWAAIGSAQQQWAAGQVISGADVYRINKFNFYKSTGSGTTGSTAPVHTSGTVSDGGVSWTFVAPTPYEIWTTSQTIAVNECRVNGDNHYRCTTAGTTASSGIGPQGTSSSIQDNTVTWTWVDSSDRTVWQIDEYGRLLIGNGDGSKTFLHRVSITDPEGNYKGELAARGTSKYAQLKLIPTNSSGTEMAVPYFQAQESYGLRVMTSNGSTDLASFDDTTGLTVAEFAMRHTEYGPNPLPNDNDTTPTVAGIGTLFLSNSNATSITDLDDGNNNQIVRVVATNANTTFVHGPTLMLTSSVNVTLTTYSSITFQKVPNIISNRWIEVARSIK